MNVTRKTLRRIYCQCSRTFPEIYRYYDPLQVVIKNFELNCSFSSTLILFFLSQKQKGNHKQRWPLFIYIYFFFAFHRGKSKSAFFIWCGCVISKGFNFFHPSAFAVNIVFVVGFSIFYFIKSNTHSITVLEVNLFISCQLVTHRVGVAIWGDGRLLKSNFSSKFCDFLNILQKCFS
jgi:hypothetical protein